MLFIMLSTIINAAIREQQKTTRRSFVNQGSTRSIWMSSAQVSQNSSTLVNSFVAVSICAFNINTTLIKTP